MGDDDVEDAAPDRAPEENAAVKRGKLEPKDKKKKKEKAPSAKSTELKPMSAKMTKRLADEYERRGVVYLSRIPPFMKAPKLRHLLSQFGDIGRIYLTPEDPSITKRRKKFKGNRNIKFVDGWVEFGDKRIARRVAASLNNTCIGGRKASFYHDDIWNIKYLKGFKWHHLTEKISYERQVREQKIRMEMAAAKRDSAHYKAQVLQARTIEAMEEKRKKKKEKEKECMSERDDSKGPDNSDSKVKSNVKSNVKKKKEKSTDKERAVHDDDHIKKDSSSLVRKRRRDEQHGLRLQPDGEGPGIKRNRYFRQRQAISVNSGDDDDGT